METKNNSVKSVLQTNKTCAFVPKGISMWPFLKSKKQTVIVSRATEDICVYDVIFYTASTGREILHRVIEIKEDGYVTCGDGLLEREFVKKENVFGIMQAFYKGKKLISARDKEYLLKVEKWYKNPKTRARKIKRFKKRIQLKNKIIRLIKGK